MAGLVPAIPITRHCGAGPIGMPGKKAGHDSGEDED